LGEIRAVSAPLCPHQSTWENTSDYHGYVTLLRLDEVRELLSVSFG
jgi:hypothetical protein